MTKRLSFLCFLLFLMLCRIWAEGHPLVVSTDEGRLPQVIKDVFCDTDGFFWYRTNDGLYQDDGYQIRSYRSDVNNPNLLRHNAITCIAEDAEKRIWFGTKRGAYYIDKQTGNLFPITDEGVKEWVIHSVDVTKDGQIWLSTNEQLFRYNKEGKQVASYPISKKILQLYEDYEGNIWRIVRHGDLARYDKEKDVFVPLELPYKEPPAYLLQNQHDGSYWISVWGRGIVRYNPAEAQPQKRFVEQHVTRIVSPSAERKLEKLAVLGDNILMAFAETGYLQLFEVTAADTLRRLTKDEAELLISGVSTLELDNFSVDRQGHYWLMGVKSGLQAVVMDKGQALEKSCSRVLPSIPTGLFADVNGYWFQDEHTRKHVYWKWAVSGQEDALVELAGSDNVIYVRKCRDRQGVYAVRKVGDLVHLHWGQGQIQKDTVFTYSLPGGESIRLFVEDASGNFWLGTNKSLWCYNLQQDTFKLVCGDVGIVVSLAVQADGKVLVATEEKQLYVFAADGTEQGKYVQPEVFSRLLVSPSGEVWAFTSAGGVYHGFPEKEVLRPFAQLFGLANEVIRDMAIDLEGNVWLLYDRSLMIYDSSGQGLRCLKASNAPLEMESLWSLCADSSGLMLVGGKGKVVALDAKVYAPDESRIEVPLHLVSVQVGRENRMMNLSAEPVVTLPAVERHVELYFSTLEPLTASKVSFAWRKQGEDSWTLVPEGKNSISLDVRSQKDFYIEVRATTPDGVWGKNILTIKIHRLTVWYQQVWLWGVLLLAVIVLLAYKEYRLRRWQEENRRVAEQLAEEALARMAAAESVTAKEEKTEEEEEVSEPTSEEKFLLEVDEIVTAHLSDSDYTVEELAAQLLMSRASLHRKLKSCAGMSPSEYIRSLRLQRGMELLKEGRLNVSEVAYSVGFNTPSYFAQAFRKQYGVLPTQIVSGK